MTEYGTIKVPRDVYERHNERRKDAKLSWAEYLDEETVTVESDNEPVDYAEIERRTKRAVKSALPDHR